MGAQAIRIQQLWDMLDAWQRKVMSAKSTMDRLAYGTALFYTVIVDTI
jgi:hypothetical protein